MKKSCGNCACIEYRRNSTVCILDDRHITGIGVCDNWEPNNESELDTLRKENKRLVEAAQEVGE